ncbi:hypothetical protein [Mesorhizobium sp. WSM1497]|uniref:hypothetical protein n=1 Tax=Mesorhizobium sp. WSM1497 TaxID=278153 RepID=UPI000A3270C8|nr:hypothetical protein [Mesorhizobium sp. WSM1497]
MKKRCIAMAYGMKPLDRIAVAETKKLIYIRNPQLDSNDDADNFGDVGFPKEFVFEPDDKWLHELESAFDSGDVSQLESLWKKGRPLSSQANN